MQQEGRNVQPRGVLVCRPTFFQVIDSKNPFMDPSASVDPARALDQWSAMVDAFLRSGLSVFEVDPVANCEDMVFTANPAFTGIDERGRRRALAGHMRYASREAEVAPQVARLRELGYDVTSPPEGVGFEGGGDAVWHGNGETIFLGIGPRTDESAIAVLESTFGVHVAPLRLRTDRFYHLDTALSVLDERTALAYPAAFDEQSYGEVARRFPDVIEVSEADANRMACNAARGGGKTVIIDRGATETIAALTDRGFNVAAVDTSEFMKSGGSVYCMKQYLY